MVLLDRLLAVGVTALALALYPPMAAVPLSLAVGGALLVLASRVAAGGREGWALQLAAFVTVSFPWGWTWRPFGLLVPALLALLWAAPRIHRHFGIESLGGRSLPVPVAMAALLTVTELQWLALLPQQQLFLGPPRGVLAPLMTGAGVTGLGILLLLVLVGTLARVRVAWWMAPWVLAPVVMAVHPLGPVALPLFLTWLGPETREWFAPGRVRLPAATAVVLPVVLGGLLLARVLPAGGCGRHAFPLRLYPFWSSPLYDGDEPTESRLERTWDWVKVTCPACELAVVHREAQRECHHARRTTELGRLPPPPCPFDFRLRAVLGEHAIPENRILPEPPGSVPLWSCETCRVFGHPSL